MIGTAPIERGITEPFQLPGGVNLPTPSAGAPNSAKPPAPAQHVALKSGTAPGTGATTQPAPAPAPPAAAPTGQDTTGGYGSAGNLTTTGANFNPSTLPPWLAQQFFKNTQPDTSESGGGPITSWAYNQNLRDQNGNPVVQIGSGYQVAGQGGNGQGVIDPSKVTYDPTLGWVTSPDNIKTITMPEWEAALLGIGTVLTAGTLGPALAGVDAAGETGAAGFVDTLGAGPETLGGGFTATGDTLAAALPPNLAADALTPNINNMIDTSLLPNVTPTTLPDLAPTPTIPDAPPILPTGGTPSQYIPDPSYTGTTGPGGTSGLPSQYIPDPTYTGTTGDGPGIVDRITNSITNDPLRAAGSLATVGQLAAGGRSSIPPSLTNTVNANGPIQQGAQQTLTNNGAPTHDQLATITSTINQQRTQGAEAIIQASVNAGQGGKDSMVVQDKIRAFNTQLDTLQMQMVQKQASENISVALQELGLMNSEQFQLAQLSIQQDNENMSRIMSIMSSLGWLFSTGKGG